MTLHMWRERVGEGIYETNGERMCVYELEEMVPLERPGEVRDGRVPLFSEGEVEEGL